MIPDRPSEPFTAAFDAARQHWTNGQLRLTTLRPLERWITRRINSPHTNHWLQLINGLEAATSTHALLHDADLFITDPNFLAGQYAGIHGTALAALGVQPVWDPWYKAHGLDHVTATWELLFNVEWARSFQPWMHRGHVGQINGQSHEFDTTLLPQCLTEPRRIGRRSGDFGFVHFNYVICTYRWFQENQKAGKPAYVDEHWRILLIRLLVNAFESTESEADVPSLEELTAALSGRSRRVDYRAESAITHYPEFRQKLQQLIDAGILEGRKMRILQEGIAPFDSALEHRVPQIASLKNSR